ncbi:MAG: DUF4395 domain-containing protein [Egibacteraceae bacterium]
MNTGMEIDVRGPRCSAAITCAVLVTAYLLQSAALLAVQVIVFVIAAFAGPGRSPYGYAFRILKRLRGWGPPPATESEAGVRFSQLVGMAVAGAALVAISADATGLGWGLTLVVIALSGLLAVTGLCVGCEVHAIGQRVLRRGAVDRMSSRRD